MTPQETMLIEEIRDGMRQMIVESRERSRVLQNLKVIVQGLQQEMLYLERRLVVLEHKDAA